jgi:hypothetical protein
MKVKVGNIIFENNEFTPMMVELTQQDKENIASMSPDNTRYAVFPDGWGTPDEMRAWMCEPAPGAGPNVPVPAGPLGDGDGQED